MAPVIGENLGGYVLEENFTRTGPRATYLARSDSGPVVVKSFSLDESDDWKSVELFERSVETLSDLEVDGVPSFVDAFDDEERGLRVLVREYVEGTSLADRLVEQWHPDQERVREIARDALRILEELHDRNPPIIHRDIKPGNIVLGEDGELRLIDFGVVRTVLRREETHPGTVVGTFGYMAPEQFRGHAVPATDLYGLGATVLRIVTGREPSDLPHDEFDIEFREHAAIDEAFAAWLDRMIAPSIEDRWDSARRARSALDPDALRETMESDPETAVAVADTVPERSSNEISVSESVGDEHAVSPDVTAARLMANAPDGCRIVADVRRHCLEFQLPRLRFGDPKGMKTYFNAAATGLFSVLALSVGLLFQSTGLLCFSVPFLAVSLFFVRQLGVGQVVEVGKGFLQVKYQLFGTTYASKVRTEIDHVEIVEVFLTSTHGKKLRIWSGVDDFLDVGGHLSPPELNWFQSLLIFCIDHPEPVRRSELFRKQIESEPASP